MDDLDLCLKAMSDETRRSIIELLLRYCFCAGAIARRLGISEPAVSQHIKILRKCGILRAEKSGYFIQYEVDRNKLDEISSYFNSLTMINRLPCDPTMENCSVKKRCICHTNKHCRGCDCCNDCKNCYKTKELCDTSKSD